MKISNDPKMLLIIGLCLAASITYAEEDVTDDQVQEFFAGCAAAQSLVTVRMESSLKELILADARWFSERVSDKSRIERMMRSFQKGYNDGNITWRELVDLAEKCSKMKTEIQSGN